MPQLVGQTCAVCAGRIGSEVGAAFCGTCRSPVHARCRKPGAPTWNICAECGMDKNIVAERAEQQEQKQLEEEARRPTPPPLEIQQIYQVYRVGRWLVGAAAVTAVGVFLLASGEPAAGVGAIAAGVGMAAVGVFLGRSR